jgi:leucyl aminopeptidase (aminopeptidase T)
MSKLEKVAKLVLFDCLELQPKQSILIVSEVKQFPAALAFHSVAAKAHVEIVSLEISDRQGSTPLLSALSRKLIQAADLTLILLSKLDHESLNWLRQQNRTRVVLFSQIDDEAVVQALEFDQRRIRDRCRKLADILSIGRNLQLTTMNGTSLKMSIAQNHGTAEIIPLLPEVFYASLPPGRAYVTPVVNSVEGEVMLNGVAGSHGGSSSLIYLRIVDGRITFIKGGKAANDLRRRLRQSGTNARMVVEMGFGLNDKARLGNSEFEDEKVLGTAHLGFGSAMKSGSKIPEIYARGILQQPSVTIDGKKIFEQGEILFG